jgi:LmbE family N-acetylglucosaminyl deacetylase
VRVNLAQFFHPDALQESDLQPYQSMATLPRGRVVVLAPHPDDEVFGCGGAILRHLAQGDPVHVQIVSDGGAAVTLAKDAQAAYRQLRQNESAAAAAVLGYGQPLFWDFADRGIGHEFERLNAQLAELLNTCQAEILYAPSLHEIHPDHHAVATAAVQAALHHPGLKYLCQYEIGAPCRANTLLDLDGLAARKRQAMRCFNSQLQLQNYSAHLFALHRYRTYTLPATCEFAEAYFILDCAALRADPLHAYGDSRQTRVEQALRTELENLYTSTSWRMSAPLRALKAVWSSLFKRSKQ